MILSRVTLASIDAAAMESVVRSPRRSLCAEIPVAVDQDVVGRHAETLQRPPCRQPLGIRHPQLVALLVGGMAHGPVLTPLRDTLEHGLALLLGEHLRVPDLVDAFVERNHGGANRQRPRP
jgi:hypothetical protein